tara:strand:+ start:748 stop:1950 length:1203 start_codon:yes stop_codon:yes gene_type:complete
MTMMPNIDPRMLEMISSSMSSGVISDEEAMSYGVGPAGPGRKWMKSNDQIALMDDNRGLIFKKTIGGSSPKPRPQPQVQQAPQRPSAPMGFSYSANKEPEDIPFPQFSPAPEPLEQLIGSAIRKLQLQGEDSSTEQAVPETTLRRSDMPNMPDVRFNAETPPVRGMEFQPRLDSFSKDMPPRDDLYTSTLPRQAASLTPKEEKVKDSLQSKDVLVPSLSMVKLIEASDSLRLMVETTAEEIGGIESPADSVIVTPTALNQVSVSNGPYRLVIDPNTNEAWVESADGELARFPVGTGDITGDRYGKKYFSPVGTHKIVSNVDYEQVQGSYGPTWLGLDAPKAASGQGYGLHGPYERESVEGDSFANKGYVSHGCMRFREKDLITLGQWLDVGTEVQVLPYD